MHVLRLSTTLFINKAPEDIPFRLRRRFMFFAGLLKIADSEFESLQRDGIAVRQKIQRRIRKAKTDG
jgi:hypothetical protein